MDNLVDALLLFIRLLQGAVLIRVLLSWVDPSPYPTSRLKQWLYQLTDPILGPLQRLIPPVGGVLDLTPMAAILLLQLVEGLVENFLGDGFRPLF